MPVLIGLKAGFEMQEKSSLFNDFQIEVDQHTSCIRMEHSDGMSNDAYFAWDVKQQGYEPIDYENLPSGHGMLFKTIKGMVDYLDSFER